MAGTLYIVPTPIGNLGDMSSRALEVLGNVDFVVCEDTRIGGKLLHLFGIKKELVSHHEHNKKQSAKYIAKRLVMGESCALISDAGTPAVSDPGEEAVRQCLAEGVTVVPLTGPCAAVCALSASGLPSRRFVFEGFLPDKGKDRQERLAALATEQRTAIVYCTPHDIEKDAAALYGALGNRRVTVCRELTKLNEQICATTLKALGTKLESGEIPQKGEFALVIEGADRDAMDADAFWADMDVPTHVAHYVSLGFSKMDAIKKTAKDRGVPKGQIYEEVIE
ncbi:MAG: 16S rRNA (cytidine(1402)-2'-O)-methyltransferase [Clostridia bacterium]|nr:16S rRNA (cytidine(1402)-2'-O)-methyltransferase [Clostridia bacterium]